MAIIDIGSNTIRLVLYQFCNDKGLSEFGNIKKVARLRSYIKEDGCLSEEGIQILANTLIEFKNIIDDYKVINIKATATAAIRQAKNSNEIIKRMEKVTGVYIQLLTEDQEAYFGYLAVAHSINTPSGVTIDIGGGSTEITLYKNKELQKTFSFPFGTVSLKQKFVSKDIINYEEKLLLQNYVREHFESLDWIQQLNLPVIAIGGSARNLAQIHQHLIDYPISGIHQYEMKPNDLTYLSDFLGNMTLEQLKQLDGLTSDRADIIGIALEVFIVLMSIVHAPSFQISKKGLREGLIIDQILQSNSSVFERHQIFEEYAKIITSKYGRTEDECYLLSSITEQFYLECSRLNLLKFQEEKLILMKRAAAFYGIGEYVEEDNANLHTFYLIANQSIDGISHKERVKLALLSSYKNKDYFKRFASLFSTWFSKEELKELKEFGAILKFIYTLNVSKRGIVKAIKLEKGEQSIHLYVISHIYPTAEIYEAERQKKHIERIFKYPVEIHFVNEVK